MRRAGEPSERMHRSVTPRSPLEAFDLITRGHVYDLGLELHRRIPTGPPEVAVPYRLFTHRTPEDMERDEETGGATFHIDGIEGTLHQSTHIDALVHCQYRGKIFGGKDMREARRDAGWTVHGVETIPPLVARGVLVDIASIKGKPRLPDGYAITADDLSQCLGAQGMSVQLGDAALIRTGKVRQFLDGSPEFNHGAPGLAPSAARYLADAGASVVAIDGPSIDPDPVPDRHDMAHVVLLVERGVPVIENVMLEELVARMVDECVFIAIPLKLTGATGSWIRPIAIV